MPSTACLILPDGQVHELHGSCTLGRHASNDIALQNDHVSRQHALIQWQQGKQDPGEGGFLLVDLGSSNGSYVNGNRVSRPVALRDGDILEFAGSRIEFRGEPGQIETPTYGTGPTETIYEVKKRRLWLMVADIVGSTRMAQNISPEDVPRINGSWFKSCRELVESHGGHMNQYLGDGFFCYWEDTLDAQQHISGLLRRFSALQAQATPPFRVVLHFGLTVLGSVPTLTSLNLHGPSVNFVFRMEKLAGSLGEPILLSEEAARILALATQTLHQAELTGYDGIHSFIAPRFDR
jgi:adenylate cyclase